MRFVLHHHTGWPRHADHYDLMLQKEIGESDDSAVLATFSTRDDRLPSGTGETLLVNFDHRRAYLEYEGPLKGERGRVVRVDAGELEWLTSSRDQFKLRGTILNGIFRIQPTAEGVLFLQNIKV